jgi:hypothetical protein
MEDDNLTVQRKIGTSIIVQNNSFESLGKFVDEDPRIIDLYRLIDTEGATKPEATKKIILETQELLAVIQNDMELAGAKLLLTKSAEELQRAYIMGLTKENANMFYQRTTNYISAVQQQQAIASANYWNAMAAIQRSQNNSQNFWINQNLRYMQNQLNWIQMQQTIMQQRRY